MEVGLGSLALGRVEQLGLRPLHVAVAGDGVALPVLRFLLLNEKKRNCSLIVKTRGLTLHNWLS